MGYWGKEEGLRIKGEVRNKVAIDKWEFIGWERLTERGNGGRLFKYG